MLHKPWSPISVQPHTIWDPEWLQGHHYSSKSLQIIMVIMGHPVWCLGQEPKSNQHGAWWYHAMEMLSALLAFCEENPLVTGGFPSQRASDDAELWCFFKDIGLNRLLNKQSSCQWLMKAWHSWNAIVIWLLMAWCPLIIMAFAMNYGYWHTTGRL